MRILPLAMIILAAGMGREEENYHEKIRQLRLEMERVKRDNRQLDADISRTYSLKGEEAARFANSHFNDKLPPALPACPAV